MVNTAQTLNGFEAQVLDAKRKLRSRDGGNFVCLKHGQKYRIKVRNNRSVRASVQINIDGKSVGKWVLGPHACATIERPVDVAKNFTFFQEESGEAQSIGVVAGASENGLVECIFIAEKQPEIYQPCYQPWDDWCEFDDGDQIFHHHHHHHHPPSYRTNHNLRFKSHNESLTSLGGDCAQPQPQQYNMGMQGMSGMMGQEHQHSGMRADSSTHHSCKAKRSTRASSSIAAGATGLQGYSNQTFGKTSAVDKDMSTLTRICFRLVVDLPTHKCRAPPRPPVITPIRPHPTEFPAPPRPPMAQEPRLQTPRGDLVDETKVQDLVEMGFEDRRQCRRLLFFYDGDVKMCVKELVRLEREAEVQPSAPPEFVWEKELKVMVDEFGLDQEEDLCKAALCQYHGDVKQAMKQVMELMRQKMAQ